MTLSSPSILRCVLCILAFCGLAAPTDSARGEAAEEPIRRLVCIGDSTVKNGAGNGAGGLWGWGQVLQDAFDPE